MSDGDVPMWDRKSGEPVRWYSIFVKYFLDGGPGRSVYGAYQLYRKAEDPAAQPKTPPRIWYIMAERWQWHERAEGFEQAQDELAKATIIAASLKLRMLTLKAVQALELQLGSDRYSVSAAREILDRGGLPATSIQELIGALKINSDEMAEATKEVAEWEKQNSEKNG